MCFRFVVTSLVVLPCAIGAVMGQTKFGRTGVSQAREPMAVSSNTTVMIIIHGWRQRYLRASFVYDASPNVWTTRSRRRVVTKWTSSRELSSRWQRPS